MTAQDIIRAIFNNELTEEELHNIDQAVQDAKRTFANKLYLQLEVGELVKIMGPIKPKYMVGRIGEVVGRTNRGQTKMVEVEFDAPMGKFGKKVMVPVQNLTRI